MIKTSTEIVPAIDVRSGRCVQLVGGDFNKERISIPDVMAVVARFEKEGAKRLHIIDLDAAKGTGDNKQLIRQVLVCTTLPVEVGGGIRTVEDALGLIDAGARWVIIGSAAVKDPAFLPSLVKAIGKERIIVALDYKDGKVVTDGWDVSTACDPLTLAHQMEPYCAQFLFTCVDKEGKMQGPDIKGLRRLRAALDIPIIASGGIGSTQDIDELVGIDAVVVGMALYTGAIELIRQKRIRE